MDNSSRVRVKTKMESSSGRLATVLDESPVRTMLEKGDRIKTSVEGEIKSATVEDVELLAKLVAKTELLRSDTGNAYYFKEILSVNGGEGAVVICTHDTYGDVAVKVYLDVKDVSFEKREKIINFTNSENAEKYVLPIIDYGFVELESGTNNYFEVQPLCTEGDLFSEGKFDYDNLVKIIVDLNEGLHFIHENGFLHMDIKPENIYRHNNRYVLGDFGITRELTEGRSKTNITHMGKSISGTPGYQAPEVLYGTAYYMLTPKTDYYSLAVTLASLYVGKFVFIVNEEYDASLFQECAQSSHINLENAEDKKTLLLQNLIDGLFQFDKNKRFGYEDVCKWIENPFYKGNLENFGNIGIKWSLPFQGSSKTDLLYTEKEFFEWIISNWDEAKYRLYRGDVERHFQMNNESFVKEALESLREVKYPNMDENGDQAIFEASLLIYSEADAPLAWRGIKWKSLQELADDIITSNDSAFFADMFEKDIVSFWLDKTGLLANDNKQLSLIKKIEKNSKKNSLVASFWFAYLFATKCEIDFMGSRYEQLPALIEKTINSSSEFYMKDGYLDTLLSLDKSYKLYGFLCSGGVDRVGCDEYVYTYLNAETNNKCEQVHLLFVLFEAICLALEKNELVVNIQKIYLEYGPYGDVKYMLYLVGETDCFCADEQDGNKILEDVKNHGTVQVGPISEMGKNLIEAKKITDKIYENMQNNPLLAEAGIYQGKVIRCRNLQGYYLFNHLDRVVPLGYKNIIESVR